MPTDPQLMILGRVLEALQSLDTHSAQRDRQVQALAEEIRRHGEVEREQAQVIGDLRTDLRTRREADERILADLRAGSAAARSNLAAFVGSPIFLPVVTALLTALLTAVGLSYAPKTTPQATPQATPQTQETAP